MIQIKWKSTFLVGLICSKLISTQALQRAVYHIQDCSFLCHSIRDFNYVLLSTFFWLSRTSVSNCASGNHLRMVHSLLELTNMYPLKNYNACFITFSHTGTFILVRLQNRSESDIKEKRLRIKDKLCILNHPVTIPYSAKSFSKIRGNVYK